MKLPADPALPADPKLMLPRVVDLLKRFATQVNQLTDGAMSARDGAALVIPVSTQVGLGDVVLNKEPEELGAGGSKYVVHGWQYVKQGAGYAWVPMRYLTGN